MDYIPIDLDNIGKLKYNVTEFKKGIKDISYLTGMYTGLINIGMIEEDVIEILKLKIENEHRKIE